jgi:uncharacterized membrane protein
LSINIKFRYLLPAAVVGMATLLASSYVLAQDGKDSLTLRNTSGFNSIVVPGESSAFFFEVANDSNRPAGNIRFTSDSPKEWVVGFKPGSIDNLSAGTFQTVQVTVTPPKSAGRGDYSVTIIADSDVGRRVIGIYVRVEQGANLWMWVGGILGVVVIAVSILIYRRFGRD